MVGHVTTGTSTLLNQLFKSYWDWGNHLTQKAKIVFRSELVHDLQGTFKILQITPAINNTTVGVIAGSQGCCAKPTWVSAVHKLLGKGSMQL